MSKVYNFFFYDYRWFLLDFKREFAYCDIFLVWETIWASRKVTSSHFYLFVAMALVENYRDIILDRNMDFTDIIKFFNEMAEKHDGRSILAIARELVNQLQTINADQWIFYTIPHTCQICITTYLCFNCCVPWCQKKLKKSL